MPSNQPCLYYKRRTAKPFTLGNRYESSPSLHSKKNNLTCLCQDIYPSVPLGPPVLMMSYTSDRQMERDAKLAKVLINEGVQSKRLQRKSYLTPYEKSGQADQWEHEGRSVSFEPVMKPVKFR